MLSQRRPVPCFSSSTPAAHLAWPSSLVCAFACVRSTGIPASEGKQFPLRRERLTLEAAEEKSGRIDYPKLEQPLPFAVHRSRMGNLPVYHDFRGGSRETTIVHKIAGDMKPLAVALEDVCRSPAMLYHGRVEVKGKHLKRVRGFLESLGF